MPIEPNRWRQRWSDLGAWLLQGELLGLALVLVAVVIRLGRAAVRQVRSWWP